MPGGIPRRSPWVACRDVDWVARPRRLNAGIVQAYVRVRAAIVRLLALRGDDDGDVAMMAPVGWMEWARLARDGRRARGRRARGIDVGGNPPQRGAGARVFPRPFLGHAAGANRQNASK